MAGTARLEKSNILQWHGKLRAEFWAMVVGGSEVRLRGTTGGRPLRAASRDAKRRVGVADLA